MAIRKGILAVLAWGMTCSLQLLFAQDANRPKTLDDPNAARPSAEAQRRLKLDQIRAAWDRQRAMFRNVRYKTSWENSENTTRTTHEYLVDKDGRYKVNEEFCGKGGIKRTRRGFDGQVYWGYWASSQIGSEANAWIEGERKFYDPTDLFDHIFDRRLQGMFDHPERVKIAQTSEGLWILTYREDRADYVCEVTVDPNQDFVMTHRTHLYDRGSIWDREYQYQRTPEGFWYPCKVERGGSDVISITAFELNVPDANLAVDIPKGTRVVDRRVDPNHPDIYPYGVPRWSPEEVL